MTSYSPAVQMQKVINHPKTILLTLERDRLTARSLAKRAEGSEFIAVPVQAGGAVPHVPAMSLSRACLEQSRGVKNERPAPA